MSPKQPPEGKNKPVEGLLLTSEERQVCQKVLVEQAPHNQRAQALLAIDQGATQVQASLKSGLTRGQVKYWLGKFRQERLAIFPKELLMMSQPQVQIPDVDVPEVTTLVSKGLQEDAPEANVGQKDKNTKKKDKPPKHKKGKGKKEKGSKKKKGKKKKTKKK